MLSFLREEKRQAISKDIMLVNNNNNNIFYRHFSFRLKRVFPCKCVAYYEGDCWIKYASQCVDGETNGVERWRCV